MISQADLDAAPKVILAGKEYPVPLLVPRQQRIVLPLLMSLMKTFAGKIDPTSIVTPELYDSLCDLVLCGLTRGSPTLTRDEFMDLETNILELIAAMNVIAQQTGVMKRAAVGEVEAPAALGEAPAGSSIGTASSPA